MNAHPVQWTSPSPLWARFAPGGAIPGSTASLSSADQVRPAILRFASDDFMDQLLAALANDPKKLSEFLARPETWRTSLGNGPDLVERTALPRLAKTLRRLKAARQSKDAVEPVAEETEIQEKAESRKIPLKLYQPAHQRYYLVTADLVCATAGFPGRAVASGGREQIGFVIRRLLPESGGEDPSAFVEHAFVKDPSGARWRPLDAADPRTAMYAGEELLPLFALNFHDDLGHPRRVIAGMIPVGRREEYMSTRKGTAKTSGNLSAADAPQSDPRKEQFRLEVTEPWKNLIRNAFNTRKSITDPLADPMPADKKNAAVRQLNDQMQMQSWLTLLDFADYLRVHAASVWNAVLDPVQRAQLGSQGQRDLFDWLNSAKVPSLLAIAPSTNGKPFATSVREALMKIQERTDSTTQGASADARTSLESTTAIYPDDPGQGLKWPSFRFLLAGLDINYQVAGPHDSLGDPKYAAIDAEQSEPVTAPASNRQMSTFLNDLRMKQELLDRLVALVVGALDPLTTNSGAPMPFAQTLQRALNETEGDAGWFVIRCVFERCDCGPLQPVLLSAPTQKFQLAGFFDPDAPARPIRIALPLDTTPAGLRKFSKNTAFMISDVLCGQIARAKGLGLGDLVMSVLPWPFNRALALGDMGPCKDSGGAKV